MRKILLLAFFSSTFLSKIAFTQSCVPTNLNGTTITVSCGNPCTSLNFQVPHLKSTETYALTSIPYNPFQYIVATGGTEDATIYQDDKYGQVFNLPFTFCFYDSSFTKAVVGSNGLITFDETNGAPCGNAYTTAVPIPNTGSGTQCSESGTYYPRAAIMAAYSDLDPRTQGDGTFASPLDRKIQWRVEGTAPCRKFIVSFYHIGVFGDVSPNGCGFLTPNTFQIVLFESTGIIEYYFERKACVSSTNSGRAIMGIQNWNRNAAVAHPTRNNTVWNATNEGWRFTPNGSTSKYVSAELLNMSGTVLATADTSTTVQGLLNISFPNICPGPTVTQYVVRTTFNSCPNGTTMVSLDTINVQRNNTLPVTSSVTPTTCGNNTGTITVTVTGTPGVPPYQFSLNGGPLQTSNVFTGLAAGTYTVYATDAGGCDTTFQLTVTASASLTHTVTSTNASCPGANNGTITVVPTAGQAPYTYTINGSPNPSGVFTNLPGGTYTIIYTDAIGCTGNLTQVVGPGTAITANATTTATSCAGANNGTITVTPTTGTAPYTYSLDGGAPQPGNVFTGVSAGTHNITIVDANGCTVTISRTVAAGTGLNGSIFQTPASCPGVNDGTVTLNPTTGVAPYTYQLDGGASQSSNVFTGVSSGLHTVVFTDANGCQGTRSINVGGGAPPATTATSANTSCAGASDGVIVIAPVAGSTYTVNPGNISNTTGTFTGLAAGTYTLSISTAGGCVGTITPSTVTIAPGPAVTTTATSSAASCPGVNDGSITVAPVGTGTTTYTLNPGAVSNTTGIFTGLAAGTYTVSFVTAAGCSGTISPNTVVTAGAAPTSTASTSSASCPGAADGTITVTPVGTGTTYTVNPGNISNTTGIFTGLSAGTYTVTFVTAAGCAGTVPANPVIASGPAPTSTATSNATTCPGVNDGSITVAPVGAGTTYTLNPGAVTNTTGIFTGLAAGTYTITFVNAAGCNGTVPVNPVITSGAAPTSTATANATSCPGVNDGSVTVAPVGTGTTYTLNPGAVTNTTGVFTGLGAGTYTISFLTAAGCTGTVPVNPVVTSGPAPTSTATSNATSCPGVNDGSVTVAPVGTGTTYTLNPGAVTNTTGVFTGLGAGTYTITFLTAAGCTGTVPVNPVVTSGPAPTSTATSNATSCPSVNDGSITVAPVGTGTTYTLNPGNISNTTGIFTGLAAGNYTISFVTAAGCNGTVTSTVVVTAGPSPTTTATTSNETCPGRADGTISVNPVGTGTTYTLNPGNISNTTGSFTALAAGTYTISFVTSNGCTGTVSPNPVVGLNAPLTGTATATAPSCAGNSNGSITVTSPVGPGTYTYTLMPGNTTISVGNTFFMLTPGTYSVLVSSPAGCGTIDNIVVPNGAPLSSTVSSTNPVCNNINDGSITVTPPASEPGPFLVRLFDQAGNVVAQITSSGPATFSNLPAGTYAYTIANSTCVGPGGPITLTTNPPIYTPAVLVNPACNGAANGSVTFSPVGGVAPYQYSSNAGGTYQGASAFNNLPAGTYTFRIRDNVGCIKDTTITLTQPTVLANAVTNSSPAGCSNNDGSISATASGGTPGYTYTIAGPTVNTTGATSGVFTGLANGSYTITARDSKGCTASATGTVNLIDNMFLFIGNDTTICEQSSITFNPQTNPETNIFTWRGINNTLTNTIANPAIKNAVATPVDTATYELYAQWGGCSRRDTIVVNVLYKPVAHAGNDTAICINTYAILSGSASHVSGGVTYEWTPATDIADPTQPVTTVTPTVSNTTLTYTLTVRDQYNCNFAVTDQVNVTVQPPVPAFAGGDSTAVVGVPHQLTASGGVSYLWSPSAPLNNANIQNPLATLTGDQKFIVQVTDIAGCIGYDTVFVKVYAGPNYYIPNAFTPNGDGLNDIFRPIPVGMAKTDWFRVFNRYGEIVFETSQWMKGWDGTFRGKKQPVGAYVWVIKGTDRNGKKIEMKGTVMLVQ